MKMTIIPVQKEKDSEGYDEYEVKEAMHCVLKAEEIKQNKELMALVNKELIKKGNAIKKITSIQDIRDAKNASPDEDEEEEMDEEPSKNPIIKGEE